MPELTLTRPERAGPSEVDGILGASGRSGWPGRPTPDQIALLREIARRAIWHMPNVRDEIRELVRHFDPEGLRQPHPLGSHNCLRKRRNR
jgi:hypothetical protein